MLRIDPTSPSPGILAPAAPAAPSAVKRGRRKRGSSDSEDEGRALAPAATPAEVPGWLRASGERYAGPGAPLGCLPGQMPSLSSAHATAWGPIPTPPSHLLPGILPSGAHRVLQGPTPAPGRPAGRHRGHERVPGPHLPQGVRGPSGLSGPPRAALLSHHREPGGAGSAAPRALTVTGPCPCSGPRTSTCPATCSVQTPPFPPAPASQARLVMDFHAHLSGYEVIGLLGGRFEAGRRVLHVDEAYPCRRAEGSDSGEGLGAWPGDRGGWSREAKGGWVWAARGLSMAAVLPARRSSQPLVRTQAGCPRELRACRASRAGR